MKYKEAAVLLGITEQAYHNKRDISELLMRAMPASVPDLAKQIDYYSHRTIKRAIAELRQMGWIHVGSWKRSENGGGFQPVFRAGQGKDRPCALEAIPNADSKRRSIEKARKEGRWDFMLAARRTRTKVKKTIRSGRKATPFDALLQ